MASNTYSESNFCLKEEGFAKYDPNIVSKYVVYLNAIIASHNGHISFQDHKEKSKKVEGFGTI